MFTAKAFLKQELMDAERHLEWCKNNYNNADELRRDAGRQQSLAYDRLDRAKAALNGEVASTKMDVNPLNVNSNEH